MLGIIKDNKFKIADKRKMLIFTDENGKKISVVNPKESHFRQAGYKEVVFINKEPVVTDNQYVDIDYSDNLDCINAEYIVVNFVE